MNTPTAFSRRSRLLARGAAALLPLLAAACGSSSDGSGDGTSTTPPPDAGSSPTQADGGAPPSAHADAAAAITPPPFVSNIPGATWTDIGSPKQPALALVSLDFLQEPTGGQVYHQWLGEVENVGTDVLCLVQLDLQLQDASGAVVIDSGMTFASADPYIAPGAILTEPCIAPGKVGSFWTNGFAASTTDTSGVKTVAVKFNPLKDAKAMPDPNAPVVTSSVQPYLGGYAVSGTLAAQKGTVSDVSIRAFPRDALGLVLGEVIASDSAPLVQGQTFSFETTTVKTPFTDYRVFLDYVEGTGMLGAPQVGAGMEDPRASLAAERQRLDAAVAARAELARSRR